MTINSHYHYALADIVTSPLLYSRDCDTYLLKFYFYAFLSNLHLH